MQQQKNIRQQLRDTYLLISSVPPLLPDSSTMQFYAGSGFKFALMLISPNGLRIRFAYEYSRIG